MKPSSHRIRPLSEPVSVPVFNLVVYVKSVHGRVEVRVANLPDLEAAAASEPMALKQVIELAKRRLASWHQEAKPVPWIEPALVRTADETERFIPVHL